MSAAERVTCGVCGRDVAVYVPKGGDGAVVAAFDHKDIDGSWCTGGRRPIRRAVKS